MYNVNDTVLYGVYGVCRIADITEKEIAGRNMSYYVLEPMYNDLSSIFVPMNNERLTSKMKRILSQDEIKSLIKNMPNEDLIWIDDEPERKERYKQIIDKGDRHELIRLIKTLHLYQKSQKEKGKKLHVADERFLKEAEKMLHDEFAHVLKLSSDQILPFILEQINESEKKTS